MKLYRVPNAPAGERWQRTQDEAKAVAKKAGGRWLPVDVPVDQRGLVAWLNERTASAVARGATLTDHPEPSFAGIKIVEDPKVPEGQVIMRDPSGQQPDVVLQPSRSRGAFKLRAGDEASQFADWVLDAEGFAVVTVLGACVERIERMKAVA